MTNKHTATFAGHTFKRNSANRVYTHVVLGLRDVVRDRAEQIKSITEEWDSCLSYVQSVAAGTDKYAVGKYPDYIIGENGPYGQNAYFDRAAARADHDKRAAVNQAKAQADLDLGRDAWIAARVAEYDQRAAKWIKTEDGQYFITQLGWAGRPDLADKLAYGTRYVKYYAKRVVLPAVLK